MIYSVKPDNFIRLLLNEIKNGLLTINKFFSWYNIMFRKSNHSPIRESFYVIHGTGFLKKTH